VNLIPGSISENGREHSFDSLNVGGELSNVHPVLLLLAVHGPELDLQLPPRLLALDPHGGGVAPVFESPTPLLDIRHHLTALLLIFMFASIHLFSGKVLRVRKKCIYVNAKCSLVKVNLNEIDSNL